jgi:hypothetical protein
MSAQQIRKAIKDHNMIFLSAQPDTPYFHWQVEIYLHQFSQHGIGDRCYALFGHDGDEPSAEAKRLQQKYPTIRFYKDERTDRVYTPGIRPHIYKKFFKDNPELGKFVFIHDSDIFLVKLPNFKKMIEDRQKRSFVSDTVNYIGFNYIKDCCKRYKDVHTDLDDLDLLNKMCEVVDIDPGLVKSREKQAGGAQYFYRNMTYEFWNEVEDINNRLYKLFLDYEKKYPIEKHIQKWTADMWGCLWHYWKLENETIVDKDLEFSWATGTIKDYNTRPIFHLAGVTPQARRVFYKGQYNNKSVFEEYNKDRGIFDHISANSSTKCYTDVIKNYFNTEYAKEKGYLTDTEYFKTEEGKAFKLVKRDAFGKPKSDQSDRGGWFNSDKFNIVGCKKFKITCDETYGNFDGEYHIMPSKTCCNKPVWKTTNGNFIIYHNGAVWVATYSRCENEIGRNGGGLASNKCDQPYFNDWNKDCLVEILCD